MDCQLCRETLSARMDNEADPADPDGVDDHLVICPQCQAWQREALRLTRSVRVRPAVPTPDLTAAVLAAARSARGQSATAAGRASSGRGRRLLLGLVALVQVVLGMSELLGVSHMGMTMSSDSEHLFNESTAWNLALGIGFAVAAVWPRMAGGLLPTLGAFLAVLSVVSVVDLVDGNVDLTRVSSHVVVLLGMALLVWVHRGQARGPGTGDRRSKSSPVAAQGELMPDRRVDDAPSRWRGLRPAGRHAA